jgi:hypothetical protein
MKNYNNSKLPSGGRVSPRALTLPLLAFTLCILYSLFCPRAQAQAQYGQLTVGYNANTNAILNTNQTLLYGVNPAQIGTSTNGQTNAYSVFPLTNNMMPLASTNVISSNPINLTRYDEFVLVFNYQTFSNTAAASPFTTNTLQFLASADGTNWNTVNTNWLYFTLSPPAGQTNAVLVTNITRSLWGSLGYLQLATVGSIGTNSTTNVNAQIWVKPRRNG